MKFHQSGMITRNPLRSGSSTGQAIRNSSTLSLRERLQELDVASSQEAAVLITRGERVGLYGLVWAPASAFLRTYLWQGEWRRGVAGLVSAVFAGYEMIVRYMKVWEHQHTKNLPPSSRHS